MTQSNQNNDLKFAYWVPNVSGGLVISDIEQRTSWDIDYNRKLARLAENSGFDYALSQIRFTAGYGAEFQHEPVSFTHALLAATERLKVIAALLPGPWNPALAAKQLATIDILTNGRVCANVVSGWFKGEFRAIGEPWLEHDERYRRSEEFIRVLKGVWTQESFTFKGDFYRFDNYSLKPKPLSNPHPEIFQGGSSRAARDMASRVSDWYFTNGNTVEGIKAQVDDIQTKARENDHRVKIGVNGFLIARETEAEARDVVNEIIAKANPEAVNAFGHEVKNAGKASPEGEGNWAKSTFNDLVQYNDGFRTNLIGTPEQIAERIVALKQVGVNLVLLGFLHYLEEVEFFGKRVLPLVRQLERAQTKAACGSMSAQALSGAAVSRAAVSRGPVASGPVASGVRSAPLLALEGVSLSFKGIRAVSDIGFEVARGEICALIGPNGAGKSSLLNVVSGVYKPESGAIVFDGQRRSHVEPAWAARQGIARTFQNIALFKGMSVEDNLLTGTTLTTRASFLEHALSLPRARRDDRRQRAEVAEVLELIGLSEHRAAPVGKLPYGLQKRVELGRALAARPRLLLLDEPFAGMSASEKQDMAELVLSVNTRLGATILLIEHDMGLVMDLSDHVVVLDYGRKIADGSPDAVCGDAAVIDAYLGVDHGPTSGDAPGSTRDSAATGAAARAAALEVA